VLWGVVFGVIQAAAPLGFWWLDPATVYALALTLIAAVYIGFAVAAVLPGRRLGRRRHPGGADHRRRRRPPLDQDDCPSCAHLRLLPADDHELLAGLA
jgi:hypothetical protein